MSDGRSNLRGWLQRLADNSGARQNINWFGRNPGDFVAEFDGEGIRTEAGRRAFLEQRSGSDRVVNPTDVVVDSTPAYPYGLEAVGVTRDTDGSFNTYPRRELVTGVPEGRVAGQSWGREGTKEVATAFAQGASSQFLNPTGGPNESARSDAKLPTELSPGDPGTARAVVRNLTAVANTPFVGLNALANLTDLERGREEGFGANIKSAGDVVRDFVQDPSQNEAVKWLEEIGFPYPQAGGLVADVFMPGPGEAKAVGSAAAKATGNILGIATALPIGRAFRKIPEAERFMKETAELAEAESLDAVETLRQFEQTTDAIGDSPITVTVRPDDSPRAVVRGGEEAQGNAGKQNATFNVRTENYVMQAGISELDGGLYIGTLNRTGALKEAFAEASSRGLSRQDAADAAGLGTRTDLGYIGGFIRDVADTHRIPAYTTPIPIGTREMSQRELYRMYNKFGFLPRTKRNASGDIVFTGYMVRPALPTDPTRAKNDLRARINLFQDLEERMPEVVFGSMSAQMAPQRIQSMLPQDTLKALDRYSEQAKLQSEMYFGAPK